MTTVNVDPRFAHLDLDSEPQTSAEAFFMASQWGHRWSHWNAISSHYPTTEAGPAISATAQADAAEASRLSAIGAGLAVREALDATLGKMVDGLGGIEDRLSEINAAVRD